MLGVDLSAILQFASLGGAAVLVLRMSLSGLWRKYQLFFAYFVFRIFNTLWPLILPSLAAHLHVKASHLYEDLWIITEPISWIFHILVVVELCRLVLAGHKGIYSLLRWAMYGSVALAICISMLALLPKLRPTDHMDTKLLGIWFATARGIDFALAIFLLLILFFLSRYPVRLNRNILLHSALFTIFFFGGAFAVFLRTFFGSSGTRTTNLILEFISVACIFTWVFFLNRRGEEVQASFRQIDPRHEQTALRQLESLNASLLKVSGK